VIRIGRAKLPGLTAVRTAAKMQPVTPAIAAPNANAISLRRLTGMLIASAASGSSRSARHARPVRDSLTKWSPARTSTTTASRR
jgi:hypothetical protein